MSSEEKAEKLRQMRLDAKIECLGQATEAVKAREWTKEAQGAKDLYSAIIRDEGIELGQQGQVLSVLKVMGDKEGIRRYVESQSIVRAPLLDGPAQ